MEFVYTPLPDAARYIRLFSIASGKDGSAIKVILHGEYRLGYQECPSYAALSYAWGPPSPLHTINLKNRQIRVRENLWMFLRQLRASEDCHLLWSDALCIDQDNVEEKNAQVRIMNHIYRKAATVIVWLGGFADESDLVMDMANNEILERPLPLILHDADWNASTGLSHLPALYSLCIRPYWARTWILQELYLASGEVIVLCGLRRTTLSKLQVLFETAMSNLISEGEAYPLIRRSDMEVPDFWNTLSTCTLRWLSTKTPQHETYLEDLLTKHRHSLCSDPRDRVYALQNMTADSSVPVDYSMDLCELYWTVLARCQSSDLRFAQIVQQALELTTLAIRSCAAIGPYQNTRPILSGDVFFRSAPTTPLTRVGTVSTTEELLVRRTFHMASSRDNVRFYVANSKDGEPTSLLPSGITGSQVQPDDIVYRLDELPEVFVILRWLATSHSRHTKETKSDQAFSEFLSNRTSHSFGVAAADLEPEQLNSLSQGLSRMNLASMRLVTKGIRPIYPDDAISAWGSSGDPCLVLNRAALVAFLEYFDACKSHPLMMNLYHPYQKHKHVLHPFRKELETPSPAPKVQ